MPLAFSQQPWIQFALVAIRVSSSSQIDTLVENLAADNSVAREAAVARLTVFGARAVERLVAVAESNGPAIARISAFRVLEAIGDPRALDAALQSVRDNDTGIAGAALVVNLR